MSFSGLLYPGQQIQLVAIKHGNQPQPRWTAEVRVDGQTVYAFIERYYTQGQAHARAQGLLAPNQEHRIRYVLIAKP